MYIIMLREATEILFFIIINFFIKTVIFRLKIAVFIF